MVNTLLEHRNDTIKYPKLCNETTRSRFLVVACAILTITSFLLLFPQAYREQRAQRSNTSCLTQVTCFIQQLI